MKLFFTILLLFFIIAIVHDERRKANLPKEYKIVDNIAISSRKMREDTTSEYKYYIDIGNNKDTSIIEVEVTKEEFDKLLK